MTREQVLKIKAETINKEPGCRWEWEHPTFQRSTNALVLSLCDALLEMSDRLALLEREHERYEDWLAAHRAAEEARPE